MRVAYVTRQYPPTGVGGIGVYVQTVATAVAAAGHDVTVISSYSDTPRSTEVVDGVRVERFPEVGPHLLWRLFARRSDAAASRVVAALSARRAVRSVATPFDVIEAPEWRAEGLLLARAGCGPLVVHLHLAREVVRRWGAIGPQRGLGARLGELLERRTVRGAGAVTATSDHSSVLPGGMSWLPELEVTRVAPPILVENWTSCRSVRETDPVVLFVGHLETRKAPEVLIEAAILLRSAVPDIEVVFVGRAFTGPDGRPYDQILLSAAAKAGVPCAILPPDQEPAAMRALYDRARVVAVPSRYETLSMVAFEALASGRPAVVTDAVGAAEWLDDLASELVVAAGDAPALAAALRPFLTDPEQAGRIGDRGRALVARTCSVDRIVNDRITVYDALVAGAAR